MWLTLYNTIGKKWNEKQQLSKILTQVLLSAWDWELSCSCQQSSVKFAAYSKRTCSTHSATDARQIKTLIWLTLIKHCCPVQLETVKATQETGV